MNIKVLLDNEVVDVELDMFRVFLYRNTPLKSKELDFVMRELPEFFHPNRLKNLVNYTASSKKE